MSWRTESESGYVWTLKFLNPQRKICGLKNIRIRLDGGERYDRIAISIKLTTLLVRQWQRNLPKFRFFFCLSVKPVACFFILFSRYLRRDRGCSNSPVGTVALPCKTTIDMRRFRWKADDLMGKGRRKRRPQLLANREASMWKQLNLSSWMLATILTKYCGLFAFKNPSSELELCV